ncbi:RTA1 like protein-domain-containing protein [Mycena alexandri]|uniref:RTA1 like protein-domain-containing protein n=1 Tax=Mycena alexandri TaxID=1745969 RepID=A0AAD6SS62_9AGAR|nr:RTA1 like protein-domain-containing protein [Mycena alexandri]
MVSILFQRSGPTDVEDSQYGYIPHEYVAIIFIVLFGISTILHIGQATYYRMWWLFPTACLCGIGELVGWSGRLWSSFSPSFSNPFMMQITTTIISPTPLIAVNFILLSWIVTRLGPCYSRLTPTWYTIIFVSCDIFALVVQGAGGGIASSSNTLSGANLGANIMLAGIVFQFVAIVTYSALAADVLRRYHKDLPVRPTQNDRGQMDGKLKTIIGALSFSTLVLFIRSIYRIIELAGGWNGRIIHTEVYFNVLDGGMVVLAIFTINFAHPGRLLGTQRDVYTEKTHSRGSSESHLNAAHGLA